MIVLPQDTDIPVVPVNMGFDGSGNPDWIKIKRSYREETHYQAFWGVLIDLIVEFLGLIINPFVNQTER
jgi:hypothetical protein